LIDMATPYLDPIARARRIESLVVQATQGGKQTAIAAALGVHESTVSRLLSEHLPKLAAILAHGGMKVVPEHYRCVDPKVADAIDVLHQKYQERVGSAVSLMWEDE